jgi:hypothetical protein
MAKILFMPCVTGGWNLDPNYATWYMDEIAVACELEANGHDVWFAEFYERKNQRILWKKTLPKFFSPGISDNFDEIYVHPKIPSLVDFMANPVRNEEYGRIKHYELCLKELSRFEGPMKCITNDDRPPYIKMWDKDWEPQVKKQLERETFTHSREATLAFPGILKRVERRLLTDKEQRWAAKWCVDNLLGLTFEKKYDFIFDGYNKWSDYAPERRQSIMDVLALHPNSATLGRLQIKGLPNLSDGKMIRGALKTAEASGSAKYKLLSWEPFHSTNGFFWTTRTATSMASDSLVFTNFPDAPNIFPRYELGSLPEPTLSLLQEQHQILREFANPLDWPEAFIQKRPNSK